MTSFNKNNDLPKEPLILNCLKPEYLKAGDTLQFDIEGEQHTISIENPNQKKEEEKHY